MIDHLLKEQMEQAFLEGRKEDALMLSQKLDIQILQVIRSSMEAHSPISSDNIERGTSI